MNSKQIVKTSKFLSLVLRHQPQTVGISLDEAGWVDVDVLLAAMSEHGRDLTRDQLEFVVQENDKQRFAFSTDGLRIRANQGHSVEVELDHAPAEPPELLFHGTPAHFVEAIRSGGLKKMKRHHVHLHENRDVATTVGKRRGKPVILTVRAGEMHRAGIEFFVTPNHVWLVDAVSTEWIDLPSDENA